MIPSFRVGQRVVVVLNAKLYDQGRVTRVGRRYVEPTPKDEIAISSDALEGDQQSFRFSEEEKGWKHLFQDPFSDALCYSTREPTYQIEGLD